MNCQKTGIPGFPRYTEHSTMIWDQIQCAKREKSDLHVVWLDLANVYGPELHKLIDFALDFFCVPGCTNNIMTRYLQPPNWLHSRRLHDGIATAGDNPQKGKAGGQKYQATIR